MINRLIFRSSTFIDCSGPEYVTCVVNYIYFHDQTWLLSPNFAAHITKSNIDPPGQNVREKKDRKFTWYARKVEDGWYIAYMYLFLREYGVSYARHLLIWEQGFGLLYSCVIRSTLELHHHAYIYGNFCSAILGNFYLIKCTLCVTTRKLV